MSVAPWAAAKGVAELVEETKLLRAGFFWMGTHPEMLPFLSVTSKYMMGMAVQSCLGPEMCHSCAHAMGRFGIHMQPPGLKDLCLLCMSTLYHEVMLHPSQTVHLVTKSVDLISKSIHALADLPEKGQDDNHKKLARTLNQNPTMDPLQVLSHFVNPLLAPNPRHRRLWRRDWRSTPTRAASG
jgi:hypothetical protein